MLSLSRCTYSLIKGLVVNFDERGMSSEPWDACVPCFTAAEAHRSHDWDEALRDVAHRWQLKTYGHAWYDLGLENTSSGVLSLSILLPTHSLTLHTLISPCSSQI